MKWTIACWTQVHHWNCMLSKGWPNRNLDVLPGYEECPKDSQTPERNAGNPPLTIYRLLGESWRLLIVAETTFLAVRRVILLA